MAHKINDSCIMCGACEPECPVQAISAGDDSYVIDATKCVDCVGFNDEPACVAVCPSDSIEKA
ncbi:4Fe-4S binding protein [Chlorobium sp. N1]|uniref:4Fe-4S binding protein n=1 Tax=Chlorobium sp. N1 TaxID=2491138 RepID=UPI001039D00E|nr:4Fe-4S binding protein [Chlorobium sp. N1]TCD46816.1 4Fe-4S dicluster domain-containing protein [Chlorobium sp. N1]